MNTSTLLVNQMVSTTGLMIQDSIPFFYIFGGFMLAFTALYLILKMFRRMVGKLTN